MRLHFSVASVLTQVIAGQKTERVELQPCDTVVEHDRAQAEPPTQCSPIELFITDPNYFGLFDLEEKYHVDIFPATAPGPAETTDTDTGEDAN